MQFIDRLRTFLAGVLSRLANKLSKPDTQLAITYKEPITQETKKDIMVEDKDPLKVVSCTVKSVKVKKVKKLKKKEN